MGLWLGDRFSSQEWKAPTLFIWIMRILSCHDFLDYVVRDFNFLALFIFPSFLISSVMTNFLFYGVDDELASSVDDG